jgi:hypothetical protein
MKPSNRCSVNSAAKHLTTVRNSRGSEAFAYGFAGVREFHLL